jgi:putative flavoprotein involved in K+ transport
MPEVVVIGAGQAGLAVSWHLLRLGVDHAVLEQGTVGDTWRTGRWDSFRLNTPAWANLLPGETGPRGAPGEFHTRDAWVDHLADYARSNGLPVEEGSPVTHLLRLPDGSFQVTVGGAVPRTMQVRAVVAASGMQRVPRLPSIASRVPPTVRTLHSSSYRNAADLPPGGVLVVGSAQSGCQIAEDLLDGGRRVWLAASPAPRTPRRYRGRDIFDWLLDLGFFAQTLSDLPDARMRWWPQPNISGIGPMGHTLSLQAVERQGAVLTGRLVGFDGDLARFAPDLGASIRMGDTTSVGWRERIDAHIKAADIAAPAPEPDDADQPVLDPEAAVGPPHIDLATEGVGCVIWATGFGPDLGWMGIDLRTERGLPVQADGEAAPGLWFLGIPWMRSRSSGIILGADRDGAHVADRLAAWLGRAHRGAELGPGRRPGTSSD